MGCEQVHLTIVAIQVSAIKMIQRINESRTRQSPLWQTDIKTEVLTTTIIGHVNVRSASMLGAVHAAQTVGRNVKGPTKETIAQLLF
jgi:uncharacterized secreted protein with C-terminal beta-propeller domain